jgi:hypothetical protein
VAAEDREGVHGLAVVAAEAAEEVRGSEAELAAAATCDVDGHALVTAAGRGDLADASGLDREHA